MPIATTVSRSLGQPGPCSLTHLVFVTCLAMYGRGARIIGTIATQAVPLTAQPGLSAVTRLVGSCAAVLGTASRGTSVQAIVVLISSAFVAVMSAFGLLGPLCNMIHNSHTSSGRKGGQPPLGSVSIFDHPASCPPTRFPSIKLRISGNMGTAPEDRPACLPRPPRRHAPTIP